MIASWTRHSLSIEVLLGCLTYCLKCIPAFAFVLCQEDGSVCICSECAGQYEVVQQVPNCRGVKARELYEKLIFPLTSDFRAIVRAGGVSGSDVTIDDVKAAEVIWVQSILMMKGKTV